MQADRENGDLDIRGTNQKGVRAYNERLVLTLIRWQGPLAKAEIAKRTGLSAQTISIIMRALEAEGLIRREPPIRGRVGQPQIPFSLNSDGPLFFGLKVGRRSSEVVLINFIGTELARRTLSYRYPTVGVIVDFVRATLENLAAGLTPAQLARVGGLGIAIPFEMWNWPSMIGLQDGAMQDWRERDIVEDISRFCPFPITFENDGSAACAAELIFGEATTSPDYLYLYVGYFIGGGLVMDGRLLTGRSGNAAAVASMPVPAPGGGTCQLIELASIATLERMANSVVDGPPVLLTDHGSWDLPEDVCAEWVEQAAVALAHVSLATIALLDVRTVVVDGWMPTDIRNTLAQRLETAISNENLAGITMPAVVQGTVGTRARSLGAAALALSRRYMVDQSAIFR